MLAEPNHAMCYTKAAIALHNYLRIEESHIYCPPGFVDAEDGTGNAIDGNWRRDQDPSTGLSNNYFTYRQQQVSTIPLNL